MKGSLFVCPSAEVREGGWVAFEADSAKFASSLGWAGFDTEREPDKLKQNKATR